MNNISLSICIATFNREAFLAATLENIISQATNQVEIVVLDGGSTDKTEDVVRGWQSHFPRLHYFRQHMNLGVDHDFAEAVSLAQGEYCWLFSDDDLLKPGAIQTVLDALKGNRQGLLIANAEVRTGDLSEVLQPQRLPLSADRVYGPSEGSRLLADAGQYLSFIGCVIIKRQLWNARKKEEYFGSFFVHVGVIFQSPLPEDTLVIAEPLVSIRYGNAMWLEKYFEIWMFKWPELIWSFDEYSDAVKEKVCAREPWRRFRTLLLHRAKGAYSLNAYRRWIEPRLESYWSRAASKLIASLPGGIANILAFVYYASIARHPDKQLLLVDLRNSRFHFGGLGKIDPRNTPPTHRELASRVSTP